MGNVGLVNARMVAAAGMGGVTENVIASDRARAYGSAVTTATVTWLGLTNCTRAAGERTTGWQQVRTTSPCYNASFGMC
jgi:hypothetical protein